MTGPEVDGPEVDGPEVDGPVADGVAHEERASRRGIQSVEIAMRVLVAVESGRGPMSLTQIGAATEMAPSKVHGYLVSLGRVGLLSQSPATGRYDLGPSMRRMGAEALRRLDETGLVSDHLPDLRDATGHSVNLCVWGENGPVVVRWQYGAHPLPITVRIGSTLPMLSSSVGRVYLSILPGAVVRPVLEAQASASEEARWSERAVARLVRDVRRDGYAMTSGGVIPGVTTLAAPVLTSGESLPLAVALAIPEREATTEVIAAAAEALLATTRSISAELGHQAGRHPSSVA